MIHFSQLGFSICLFTVVISFCFAYFGMQYGHV